MRVLIRLLLHPEGGLLHPEVGPEERTQGPMGHCKTVWLVSSEMYKLQSKVGGSAPQLVYPRRVKEKVDRLGC